MIAPPLPTFAEVQLWVSGLPQPQGSKTAFTNRTTGKPILVEGRRPEARDSFQAWRQAVRTEGQRAQERCGWSCTSSDPVVLEATFYLPRPVSYPKWRWLPRTRPDLDKLCRAIEDALTAVLFTDDSLVVDLHVRKRYAVDGWNPGVAIRVQVVDERGATPRGGTSGGRRSTPRQSAEPNAVEPAPG